MEKEQKIETKKLNFEVELTPSGEKMLIRCTETKELTTGLSSQTLGNFIRKQFGFKED